VGSWEKALEWGAVKVENEEVEEVKGI